MTVTDVLTAKKLVIEAGERLVSTGLIARTWGNVSCRIDDKTFVITPSGRPYMGLTPDDIVEVSIDSLGWSGSVKPSSEKGTHAEVYKRFPNANFVIHTHQKVASAISVVAGGIEKIRGEAAKLIGERVYTASYGLPGTKTLRKGVAKALRASSSRAVLMARHGALCFGKDPEEAFQAANSLEKVCTEYILETAKTKLGIKSDNLGDFCTEIGEKLKKIKKIKKTVEIDRSKLYNSRRDKEKGEIVFTNKADGSEFSAKLDGSASEKPLTDSARAQRDIYRARPDFNYIIHNDSKEVAAVSRLHRRMKPLLDDFTQICGVKVKAASPKKCAKAIRGKNAALVKDLGALCCGSVESDARAVDMIMTKSCLTALTAELFGGVKAINPAEALLMRFIYLRKYSKQASK